MYMNHITLYFIKRNTVAVTSWVYSCNKKTTNSYLVWTKMYDFSKCTSYFQNFLYINSWWTEVQNTKSKELRSVFCCIVGNLEYILRIWAKCRAIGHRWHSRNVKSYYGPWNLQQRVRQSTFYFSLQKITCESNTGTMRKYG
jgi:hypothetical protein